MGKNCLSSSFAMVCGVSEDEFRSHLLPFDNWHYQECMLVAWEQYSQMCMPLYRETFLEAPFNREIKYDFSNLSKATMILLSETHAVACSKEIIFDPKGFKAVLSDIQIYPIIIVISDSAIKTT